MVTDVYTGVLTGPEGGPYRVVHNLSTRQVEVSLRGYLAGPTIAVIDIPPQLYTFSVETENVIIVDTAQPPRNGLPVGGRLVANGMTVVITPLSDKPADQDR